VTPARLKELCELAAAKPCRWDHTADLLDEVERLRAALELAIETASRTCARCGGEILRDGKAPYAHLLGGRGRPREAK
jgi:hypothetical protein